MRSLLAVEATQPPRLLRAVCAQIVALAIAAVVAEIPWARREPTRVPERPPPPKRTETRIRVVQVPRPPPPQPTRAPQPQSVSPPPAPAPAQSPRRASSEARARIAADSTAVHGVRLRVLVPRSPNDLAAHLRNSGGCMVVSRLSGGEAEVLSVLGLDGQRAVERPGPPCNGVPRLLRDAGLNQALGDPLSRVRAALPASDRGDDLVLQVLLSPRLHDDARHALRARFGAVPEEEIARRAADAGYELTCFAEPEGSLRCN